MKSSALGRSPVGRRLLGALSGAFALLGICSLPSPALAEPPAPAPVISPLPIGPADTAGLKTIDRLEASVNSQLILLTDVTKFRRTEKLRSQLDPLFAGTPLAQKGELAPISDIVTFLIDEKMIVQQFPVTDQEVEQEINNIQANNHIDRGKLRQALLEQGFTFDDYFELIRSSASKRNLIDRDIRTKVSISDDDVKNYFFNHYSKDSATPLTYHLGLITVSIRNFKSAAAARDVAESALKSIRGGDQFDDVAKRSSDDANASTGGDLGTVSEDQIAPVIRAQLKGLQIGQTSDVFGGPAAGAFYILKLLDVKSGDSDRYNRLKDEIRNQLSASEYQHQIQLWLERQRQVSFIHRSGEDTVAGLPKAP